eukprot:3381567-Amphidinium_carterae.1
MTIPSAGSEDSESTSEVFCVVLCLFVREVLVGDHHFQDTPADIPTIPPTSKGLASDREENIAYQ